jgi:hypothetical protein
MNAAYIWKYAMSLLRISRLSGCFFDWGTYLEGTRNELADRCKAPRQRSSMLDKYQERTVGSFGLTGHSFTLCHRCAKISPEDRPGHDGGTTSFRDPTTRRGALDLCKGGEIRRAAIASLPPPWDIEHYICGKPSIMWE